MSVNCYKLQVYSYRKQWLENFYAIIKSAGVLVWFLYYIIHKWSVPPKTLGKVTYSYIATGLNLVGHPWMYSNINSSYIEQSPLT